MGSVSVRVDFLCWHQQLSQVKSVLFSYIKEVVVNSQELICRLCSYQGSSVLQLLVIPGGLPLSPTPIQLQNRGKVYKNMPFQGKFPEVPHKTFTQFSLVRTCHMATPNHRGVWEVEFLAGWPSARLTLRVLLLRRKGGRKVGEGNWQTLPQSLDLSSSRGNGEELENV